MTYFEPIRFGLTGLGGYSRELCERLLEESTKPLPKALLKAVCVREPARFSQRVDELRGRGVVVLSDYAELLAQDLDAVWLPLPIDLHRQYMELALKAGKPVMCEKPAAGCVDDVDAMIAARDRSGLPVGIGYQDVYQPAVHELKRRIVRGEFGVVLSGSVIGCWPRAEAYFSRNAWAGKISRDGRWILDSPANNAVAHYLHLALFLLGSTERESAVPTEVEAELYRANEIENYDTCSLRLTFDGGTHLMAALTHACRENLPAEVVIRTQSARIRYVVGRRLEIHRTNVSELIPLVLDRQTPIIDTMRKWLREGMEAAPGGTLEMARAHTVAVNAASQAAPIVDIPADQIETVADEKGSPLRVVGGIETAMQASILHDRMLHETGLMKWSRPASEIDVRGYSHFPGPRGSA